MADGIFKSVEHKQRFLNAIRGIGKIWDGKFDPEYAAALYLLTEDENTWLQSAPYVRNSGIDIENLLKKGKFSSGYKVLIKLAGNLFNSNQHVDPIQLLRLDEDNFRLALFSIFVRRYGLNSDASSDVARELLVIEADAQEDN